MYRKWAKTLSPTMLSRTFRKTQTLPGIAARVATHSPKTVTATDFVHSYYRRSRVPIDHCNRCKNIYGFSKSIKLVSVFGDYLNGWPRATQSFWMSDSNPLIVRKYGSNNNCVKLEITQHMSRPSFSCKTTVFISLLIVVAASSAYFRHNETYNSQHDLSKSV